MKTRKQFAIASVVMLCSLLAGVEAKAQAYSSGGGSETGHKSTLGYENTASGNYSLAAGRSNQTTGEASFALGYQNTATGKYSFAAGWGNQANGQTSFALGYYSKTTGLNSLSLGMHASSQANYGITIGRGLSNTKPLLNTTSGIMLGMYSNVPTLYISQSSGENTTGKIGIGNVTSPQAKLHIKGDATEHADIFLASTGSNNSVIRFRNDDNNITVGSNNAMLFNAASMQFNPTSQVVVNGAFKATGNVVLSALASSTPKLLTVGANGQLATTDLTTEGDNLGNHTATQNLNLNGKKIVNGTTGTGGIFVSTAGKVRIGTGTTTPSNALEVNGTTVSTSLKISGLASPTQKVLTVGTGGQVSATDGSTFADNMGDHTAAQNINLNGKKIVNGTSGAGGIFVSSNGNVGVNTDLPKQMLHLVDGNVLITKLSTRPPGSTNGSLLFGDEATTTHPYGRWGIEYLDQDGVKGLNFWKTADDDGGSLNHVLFLCSEEDWELKGNVGIGTGKPKEKLSVNGKVLAKEVIVTKDPAYWPDYVFAPGYEMMSLAELEAFVNEHHHLPDVPSAKEIGEHGISLGEMNAILLQKVEEMTLRMIEMEKRIQELEAQSDMNTP